MCWYASRLIILNLNNDQKSYPCLNFLCETYVSDASLYVPLYILNLDMHSFMITIVVAWSCCSDYVLDLVVIHSGVTRSCKSYILLCQHQREGW